MIFLSMNNPSKNIKLKKLMEALKEASTEAQLYLIEEFEESIRKEEQKRISQNLHDELAGTLAAVKNIVELILLTSTDETQKKHLTRLNELINDIFDRVRNKSHELNKIGYFINNEIFKHHIYNLIQITFPTPPYIVNVHLDNYAVASIPIELRLELIPVIQEAFTNILKHAKATHIDLLIYKENNQLIVFIKDNGVGMEKEIGKETLGIHNMMDRLDKFGGFLIIQKDTKGFEIIISIPDAL